ncbi:unnamed protein product [Ambrosiozyma monospora]|uniref:Unnamed protein product n=1 Tax=Ambrosiozyma monospora TaxID=43982 RepID=A0A9W6YMV7_AMBMO|nr:unnamed protein product [Ambrosiozyma monospora]
MSDTSHGDHSINSRNRPLPNASYLDDYSSQDLERDFELEYGSVLRSSTRRPYHGELPGHARTSSRNIGDQRILENDGDGDDNDPDLRDLLSRNRDVDMLSPDFDIHFRTGTTEIMDDEDQSGMDSRIQDEEEDDDEDDDDDDDDDDNERGEMSSGNNLYIDPNKPLAEDMLYYGGIRKLEVLGLVDIGNLASWNVSSAKSGYGVRDLREDTPSSYWQSDGSQPHFITVHFTKCVSVERISLFLNYQADESYTPSKILILAGSGEHDLIEVSSNEFIEPVGWQHITFKGIRADNLLKCYLIKICFLSNHQNGKDSHVRSIKVFSPVSKNSMNLEDSFNPSVGFTSTKLKSESVIR